MEGMKEISVWWGVMGQRGRRGREREEREKRQKPETSRVRHLWVASISQTPDWCSTQTWSTVSLNTNWIHCRSEHKLDPLSVFVSLLSLSDGRQIWLLINCCWVDLIRFPHHHGNNVDWQFTVSHYFLFNSQQLINTSDHQRNISFMEKD